MGTALAVSDRGRARPTFAHLVLVHLVLGSGIAWARTPPMVADPREGVWLGAGELYIHQSPDKWSVFPAGATVNKLASDGTVLWIATDDGAIRLDSATRGAARFGIDDGLPSQAVASIAVDERFVWFATNKGLARYRKLDRTWRVFTDADGLPHRAVNDILVVGRQVWLATRAGLALYDTDVDGVRALPGASGDDMLELFLVGEDLWCRTDAGLSRFRPRTRTFSNFSFAEMGATELRAWAIDGGQLWLGTDQGLVSFETSSDTFQPFPQQDSLRSRSIRGLEVLSDYLFITTDAEVVQFHKVNKSFRLFTVADGLTFRESVVGTLLAGGVFTVLFADGAEAYVVQRDVWTSRALSATQAEQATKARFFGRTNSSLPYDALRGTFDEQRYATAEGGFGFFHRFDARRSLDVSARLDYGQVELPGIRELTARLDYQGAPTDTLRELRAEDSYKYRTLEEGLDRPLVLRGGELKLVAEEGAPKVSSTATGGLRRGTTVRDFINGAKQSVVPLSHRYILPGSERVRVDGELLTNGTDYTIIYPAGQLAFLDLERVDELSVIEVEYEVDLQPRKGLGVLSLLDLLPADREVGDWTRAGEARMISDENGLYAQIDGAAPRYLDRGWVKSVFVEYRQGGRTVTVAIYDLGTDANAQALYDFDLPPAREAVEGRNNVVLDLGLATAYAVKAVLGTFYLELTVDEKSDAARQSIKLFALQILDRGSGAGANNPGETPEWLGGFRVAAKPADGLETGLRFVKVLGTGQGPTRDFLTTLGDARYERALGAEGLLTGYAELGGSIGQGTTDADGYAALGSVRWSHPLLEGTVSMRHQSPTFTQLGTSSSRFGRLASEGRAQLTAYPVKWLPTTGFFTRSWSSTPDGRPGIEQHALARVQLTREGLPTASVQIGHSLLGGAGNRTGRLKGVAQLDYDLAQGVLSFLKLKRFVVRGLYALSQAEVVDAGQPRDDQVQLLRLEARLAPTATESGWVLFRNHLLQRRKDGAEDFSLGLSHWELNAGARSAIIPGLIPQVTYAAMYNDDQVTQPVSVRVAQGNIAAALGIQPGRWWSALAALMVEPRVSVVNEEKAEGLQRTGRQRTTRLDNRIIWAGGGKLDVELIQLFEAGLTGKDAALTTRKLDLRNRIVVRPRVTSPVTGRFNFSQQETANDATLLPGAPALGLRRSWEGVLEWLSRWNQLFTTRLRAVYGGGAVQDVVQRDALGTGAFLATFLQHRIGPELELRLTRTTDTSNLFLVQRDTFYRLFGTGIGASQALAFSASLGVVLALGDKLYLDAEVAWQQTVCLAAGCAASRALVPRALLTVDL